MDANILLVEATNLKSLVVESALTEDQEKRVNGLCVNIILNSFQAIVQALMCQNVRQINKYQAKQLIPEEVKTEVERVLETPENKTDIVFQAVINSVNTFMNNTMYQGKLAYKESFEALAGVTEMPNYQELFIGMACKNLIEPFVRNIEAIEQENLVAALNDLAI